MYNQKPMDLSETNGFKKKKNIENPHPSEDSFIFFGRNKRDSQGARTVSDMDIIPFFNSKLQSILS